MSEIILNLGGTRSGKSEIAEKQAAERSSRVVYIATCIAGDEELRRRVEAHRLRRPAGWLTLEAPLDPLAGLRDLAARESAARESAARDVATAPTDSPDARRSPPQNPVVLIDCLSFLVFNLMEDGLEDQAILERVRELLQEARHLTSALILVTNDISNALIPTDAMSRRYQDLLGRVNQLAAAEADSVYLAVAGIALAIKSHTR